MNITKYLQRAHLKPVFQAIFWAYLALITYLSLLPSEFMPGISVWDKIQHCGAYFVMSILVAPLCQKRQHLVIACLGIIGYSGVMELLQGLSPGRDGSWLDMLANSLGVAIAVPLLIRFSYSRKTTL
jgi:VanZ family protein